MTKGRNTTGNIIAGICSFFIPGLGQLLQGRLIWALVHFIFCVGLWFVGLGWIAHIWSAIDAAIYKAR